MELASLKLDKLAQDLPVSMRLRLAEKTAENYVARKLNAKDRKIAEMLFLVLARDVEVRVRQVLAEQLRHDPELPRELALLLAKDVSEVAVPMLRYSLLLGEDDLIEIVKATEQMPSLLAVAHRDHVSEKLCVALIEKGIAEIVTALTENEGAEVTQQVILCAAERFPSNGTLLAHMLNRTELSLAFAEQLVCRTAEHIRRDLLRRFNLSRVQAARILGLSEDWALLSMLTPNHQDRLPKLVDHLAREGRLTDAIIMRALCMGHLDFFAAALGKRADVSFSNARKLMLDAGPLGFMALYKAAEMPEGVFEAVKTVLKLALDETHGGRVYRPDYQRRIVERILVGGYDRLIDHMPYMLTLLRDSQPEHQPVV